MNGNNIIVYWNDTPIAAAKSAEINCGVKTIEVASTTTGAWKTFIAGRKDWSVSVGYLVLAASGLADLLKVGTTYTIKIGGRGASGYVSGSAILTTCKITATRGNLVTGSFAFKGSGELAAVNLSA